MVERGAKPVREKLCVEDVWAVATQLSAGLTAIHGKHILHLDIKPDNVLWDDRMKLLKIIDFGMAEKTDKRGVVAEPYFEAYSTRNYRCAELYAKTITQTEYRRILRPSCDVWSFGATVFEIAAGGKLIAGCDSATVINNLRRFTQIPEYRRGRLKLAGALTDVCTRALEIKPYMRDLIR